jgi:NAD(P)-dependent dehydrogenase (short-subunit alcohol dehydrogenase family)
VTIAVVTGGGRGIGREIALALAARDLDVALLGRNMEHLERTAGEIIARGRRALALACDVALSDEVDHAAKRVAEVLGVPSVVVNNAGIVKRSLLHETTEADWDAVIDTNLRGPFLVTRAFLPKMLERRAGRIVMVSSISATIGSAGQASYAASKWGLTGLMKSLAEELRGTGLVTLAVVPGSVDTDMLKGSGFSPAMTAAEVAKVVTFAALDAPSAMNGSAIEMFGP